MALMALHYYLKRVNDNKFDGDERSIEIDTEYVQSDEYIVNSGVTRIFIRGVTGSAEKLF